MKKNSDINLKIRLCQKKKSRKKYIHVAALLAVCTLLVVGIECAYRLASPHVSTVFANAIVNEKSNEDQQDITADKMQLYGIENNDVALCLDQDFRHEMFDLSSIEHDNVYATEGLISFWISKESDAYDYILSSLSENGWSYVRNSELDLVTGSKPKGRYTWIMLQCARYSLGSSIVIHYY